MSDVQSDIDETTESSKKLEDEFEDDTDGKAHRAKAENLWERLQDKVRVRFGLGLGLDLWERFQDQVGPQRKLRTNTHAHMHRFTHPRIHTHTYTFSMRMRALIHAYT